jgi:hypothetical protein
MKSFTFLAVIAAAGLILPLSHAADGCCDKNTEKSAAAESCGHAAGGGTCGHAAAAKTTTAAPKRALPAELQPVFASYLEMQVELAKDSTKALVNSGKAMASAMRRSGSGCLSGSAGLAEAVSAANDLRAARAEFAKLSEVMYQFVSIANVEGYHAFYCQMAKAGWLQSDERMNNPYMGPVMLECGKKVM